MTPINAWITRPIARTSRPSWTRSHQPVLDKEIASTSAPWPVPWPTSRAGEGTLEPVSIAAAHADAFYREVAAAQRLWTIRDESGIPAPVGTSGAREMPFWSRRSRAAAVIAGVAAYRAFTPVDVSWADFTARWVPGLERDGLRVGVNWSGERASGYDVAPSVVVQNVTAALARAAT
jgi:hypothetical protein